MKLFYSFILIDKLFFYYFTSKSFSALGFIGHYLLKVNSAR